MSFYSSLSYRASAHHTFCTICQDSTECRTLHNQGTSLGPLKMQKLFTCANTFVWRDAACAGQSTVENIFLLCLLNER